MDLQRYERQIAFEKLGEKGQRMLASSRVAIIGLGALGSVSGGQLARSGIGSLRIVDGDTVNITNLHRQILYTQKDAANAVSKVIAAKKAFQQANSNIEIQAVNSPLTNENIDAVLENVDLVVDASDNFEVRLLINEACRVKKIPWIYGAAVRAQGMTMNFLSGKEDPCLACVLENNEITTDPKETCAVSGVLSMITGTIASIQAVEAVKILTDAATIRKTMLHVDLWENTFRQLEFSPWKDCPVCKGVYSYYE